MTRTINGIDELKTLVGEHLGYSPYVEITQAQVNTFADATGDHQWIHIDVERANSGPFGGPNGLLSGHYTGGGCLPATSRKTCCKLSFPSYSARPMIQPASFRRAS